MTLDLDGIEWVRLVFVDLFGGGHALHLPVERFASVAGNGVPFDGSALEGHARNLEADMLLLPDMETLVAIDGGLARVACTVLTTDGKPWPSDPRVALGQTVDALDELTSGYTVGAELELYLLDAQGRPVDDGGYYDEDEGLGVRVVRAAASRLGRYGVPVDACHYEAGPGQFEIDLAAQPPLALADGLVLARQVLREEASAAGVRATFLARPIDGEAGSGLHLHQRADILLGADGLLTDDGRAFVSGQLRHARALSALAAPTVNSYKRLHSGPEAPSVAMWAHHNRSALIRVSSFRGGEASIEYRGADPSANPYLLLAAMLTAGADGIESGLELPPPSDEGALGGYDPATASARFDALPRDLDDALDSLMADDVLVDAFDSSLLGRLVDGLRAETAAYRSHVTQWELGAP